MPDAPDRDHAFHQRASVDLLDRAIDAAAVRTAASTSVGPAVGMGRDEARANGTLDPDLAATIDTLWTMHARSAPAGPDAAFVARLREDLMHASPLPLPVPTQPRPSDNPPRTPTRRARMPIPAWATSGAGAIPTILTIAVAIALVIASVGWWDRSGTPPAPTPSEVAFGAATPPPASTIALSMSDTAFSPAVLDVPPGTPSTVTLEITNTGSKDHTVSIPRLGIAAAIPAGETRSVTLSLQHGVYAFFAADAQDVKNGLFGQLTVPVGTGASSQPAIPPLASFDTPIWSNATVTMKALPVSDGRPMTTYPAGMAFQPVSISGTRYGGTPSGDPSWYSQVTVHGMSWTLVLEPGSGEVGWIETGHLTTTKPAYAFSTPVVATPAAALAVPATSTAGGPGRSWTLSDANPRTGGYPRQITADMNFAVTSALVVGDSIVVSGNDTTSQYGMGEIRRIDLRTGATIWSIPAKPRGDLAAQGNLLYTFTVDRKKIARLKLRVSAFSLSTGEEVWTGPELDAGADTGGYGPVLLDGMLFATDPAGNTVALDPATGATHWQYPATTIELPVTPQAASSMIGVDGAIIVATTDHRLVRLDASTGAVETEVTLLGDIWSIRLGYASGDAFSARVYSGTGQNDTSLEIVKFDAHSLTRIEGSGSISSRSTDIAAANGSILTIVQTPSGPILTQLVDGYPARITIPADSRPTWSAISRAGDTVMQLGPDGTLTFLDVVRHRSWTGDIPIATSRTTQALPPLMWNDVPVVVASDGTIWALDGAPGSPSPDDTGTIMAFNDDGFMEAPFAATTDTNGIVTLTLYNDGTQPRIIAIPGLGIDAHLPAGTTLTVKRSVIPAGNLTMFAHTDEGIDSTPGFFANISVSGTIPPASNRPLDPGNTFNRSSVPQRLAAGTTTYAVPGDEASAITTYPNETNAWPLILGEPPSGGITTVTDASGVEWTLVLVGAYEVGWVPSGAVLPLETYQTTPATPLASANATPTSDDMLNPNSETLRISIDIDGVIAGNAQAMQQLGGEVQRVFAPYVEAGTCQIGFVLISTRSPDITTGVEASDAVANRIEQTLPALLPEDASGKKQLVSESIALPGTKPEGEVELQVFVNAGCIPVTPEASPAP